MKRFIIKIIIISLAVLIIFSAMNLAYINSDFFKTSMINWTRFKNVPGNLDIVNTGSSHAASGIDYSILDNYNSRSFAAAGQTFQYDLKLLEQFSENFNEGGTVIIPISYLSFSKIDEDRQKKQSLRYYRILELNYIDDFNLSDYMLYKVFPILTSDKELISAIKRYFQPKTKNASMADLTEEEIAAALEKNKTAYFDIYEFDPNQVKILGSIVEFVQAKGMTPVLITIPVSDVYTMLCTDEIMNDFYTSIEYIENEHEIIYYDYGAHPDFADHYDLFTNTSHLNDEGALTFSKMMFTDLGLLSD